MEKYQLKIMKKDGTYGATVWEDPYMKAFVRNLALRPSCGTCAFKGYEQVADITLADYWGVEQLAPELDDDKGGCPWCLSILKKGRDCLKAYTTR